MNHELNDEERALRDRLGGAPESPRRSDDAFARAVYAEVLERRRGAAPRLLSLFAGAGALASVALVALLTSAPSAVDDEALLATSLAALDEEEPTHVDALSDLALLSLTESGAYLGDALADEDALEEDDEDELSLAHPWSTDALPDDELLALASRLDEALSL